MIFKKFIATAKEKYRFLKIFTDWSLQKNVSIFAGDNYNIILDRDTEVAPPISFLLILDNMTSKNKGNIITLDFELICMKVKKFNANWKPK